MNNMIKTAADALSNTGFGKAAKVAAGFCIIGAGSTQLISCGGLPPRPVTSSATAGTLDANGKYVPVTAPAAIQTMVPRLTGNSVHEYGFVSNTVVTPACSAKRASASQVALQAVPVSATVQTDSVLRGAAQAGQFLQGVGALMGGAAALGGQFKSETAVTQEVIQNANPNIRVGGASVGPIKVGASATATATSGGAPVVPCCD